MGSTGQIIFRFSRDNAKGFPENAHSMEFEHLMSKKAVSVSFPAECKEMEFLDVSLTKDSSLLLQAIYNFLLLAAVKKHTLLWFY
jgi:hypothetical protein